MDFQEIEDRFATLKADYEAGNLEAESFQAAVDELRIEDEFGRHWMIGIESGNWFYFDGTAWTQADPAEADTLPYVDENGTYWSLNEADGEWMYFDGNNWVKPGADQPQIEAQSAFDDDSEYFQDEEGRYWTIGKKSGEWYYYDEAGWHKATETPASDQFNEAFFPEDAPYYSPPPAPQTGAFNPVQPQPAYPPYPAADTYSSTRPMSPQQGYAPVSPAGYTMPQAPLYPQPTGTPPGPNPYDYTQPLNPQAYTQPQPAYNQPMAPQVGPYPQPGYMPQYGNQPVASSEPGVWMYFDGEKWLKYKDDPAAQALGGPGDNYDDFDDDYDDDALSPEEEVIQIEDIDEFVEVVEVEDDDILEEAKENEAVDAEFRVEVMNPGRTGQATAAAEARAAAAAAPATPRQNPTQGMPKVAPQTPPDLDTRIVPAWFWTSLVSVILLAAVGLLLVGILLTLNNREDALGAIIQLETPTLESSGIAAAATPTVAPTPSPTVTAPPTITPVPTDRYESDYFGITLNYPGGWVSKENDDLVIFAPSTRALDNTKLTGAAMWVSLTENAEQTELFANGLERFSPILERLEEGAMTIGDRSWLSAQVRFDSPEFGQEGIALVASTVQNEVGYTLIAVAPATEWEDFIHLFQYPVNSFSFIPRDGIAVAAVTPTATQPPSQAAPPTDEPEPEQAVADTTADEPVAEANSSEEDAPTNNEGEPAPSEINVLSNTVTITSTSLFKSLLTRTPEAEEAEEPEPTTFTYEVVSGDTLSVIAERFGLSTNALVQANGLGDRNAIIRVGQELTIPQGDVAVATAIAEAAAQATEAPAAPAATPTPVAAPISGRIVYPAYSPDIRSFNIWSTNVDGSNQVIIVGNASQPQFNESGNLFAYRSWIPSQRGVYFVDFPTGRQGLLTGFIEDGLPAWSKDGTFVISSRREGDRAPRLYRVRQDKTDTNLQFNGEYPDILSDGRIISRGCSLSGECGLWVLGPNGGGATKISSDTSDTAPGAHPGNGPVVFMSFDRANANNWEIWSMNPDGSNVQRLTEDGANDGLPVWSPDGNHIAFVSDRGGVWGIWAMNPDGSNQRKLFNMPASPNGVVEHDEPNSKGWLEERISWVP